MLYEYAKTQLPCLCHIHNEVIASAMTDKEIEWCSWDESEQKLKVNFINTLSTEDETLLGGIVGACPDETNDSSEEMRVITKSANYTATYSDSIILGDSTSAEFTITLPTAVDKSGKIFMIKCIVNVNKVNIQAQVGETIDGSNIYIIDKMKSITLISDGANWYIV